MLAQLLKSETQAAHRQLDHHPLLKRLFEVELDASKYAVVLQAMHGVQSQCEKILAEAAARLPPHIYHQQASRIPLLECDLLQLGIRTNAAVEDDSQYRGAIDSLNLNVSDARQVNASYVGMAYVMEGSALGGQYIAKYLQKVNAALPIRFFSSDGLNCQERWASFWDFAKNTCPANQHHEAVIAAISTFDLYREHMDKCLVASNK